MAVGKTFKRGNSKTTWVVEFYPFNNPDPSDDSAALDGVSALTGPITVISSGGAVNKNDLVDQLKTGGLKDSVEVQRGLTALNIKRSKRSPEGSCNFTFVGPVPKSVVAGTWVIVSSVTVQPDGSRRNLMRFIGQIHTPNTNYIVQPSGNLVRVTNVAAREWSAMLNMPVKFDLLSIFAALPQNLLGSLATIVGVTGEIDNKNLAEMVKKAYNPFEFAHLILTLVGGINQDDTLNNIKALGIEGLKDVALTMPSIPKRLLNRLGLPAGLSPQNPFAASPGQKGFVDVLTGVQQTPFNNDGQWDGIFRGAQNLSAYKEKLQKELPDRPVSFGIAAIAQAGMSAWQMLSQYCDPSINECFTDIYYEETNGSDGKKITARPVIVFRDKPWLMAKFESGLKLGAVSFSNWTKYDHLPRVRLNDAFILGLSASHTLLNSPNLIRVNYHSSIGAADIDKLVSQANGRERLEPHMRRWGGQEFYVETTFLGVDTFTGSNKDFDWEGWIKSIKEITKFWHSYSYRMGNGSLVMKDDGSAVSCGLNVQFTFGSIELVAHVAGIDINFRINEAGIEETSLQLDLERIVTTTKDQLEFVEMSDFGSLHTATPKPSIGDNAALIQGVDTFTSTVSGILS